MSSILLALFSFFLLAIAIALSVADVMTVRIRQQLLRRELTVQTDTNTVVATHNEKLNQ
jgi:cell division protein FtsB